MRFLLAFVVIGILVYLLTVRAPSPMARSSGERDTSAATPPRENRSDARAGARDTVHDVRDNVARAGDTLQEKARVAGDRIDDARVITVIKSKFALDRELAAGAISVSCQDGRVVLDGTVLSQELADRALQQAQSTEGVLTVTSHLTIGAAPER
ncbi:MAG: BON domain-containing protein [Opitutae bacterium]|nr:BON domain-containing protein [Opitutae bacterium]